MTPCMEFELHPGATQQAWKLDIFPSVVWNLQLYP